VRALPNPPAQFGFKDAKQALGAPNNRTNESLKKCRQHQLIEKLAKNHYRKLATPSGSAPTPANSPENHDDASVLTIEDIHESSTGT